MRVGYGWSSRGAQFDMIQLEVDRAHGKGFALRAMDTTLNYNDSQAFLATPTKWSYRGMYYMGDSQLAKWSDPTSLNVGG